MEDKKGRYKQDRPTLCWRCKNTNRFDCTWFNPNDPQPVPGWVAEPREMYSGSTTYLVKECPKFEPEQPRVVPAYAAGVSIPGVQRRVTKTGIFWEARIMHKGENYYLGRYIFQEDATAARQAAERAVARGELPRCAQTTMDSNCPGVYRGKRNWRAVINHQGKRYHLGYFTTEEKAIAARKAAEEAIERGEIPAH